MDLLNVDRVVTEAGEDFGDVVAREVRPGDDFRWVFVRDDGWTLAASEGHAADAFAVWRSSWVVIFYVATPRPDGRVKVLTAYTPDRVVSVCEVGLWGDRGHAYRRHLADQERENLSRRRP